MIYLLYLLFLVLGYVAGYCIRQIFARLRWGKSSCNIQKKGILGRAVGGLLICVFVLYFQVPYLMFVVGFMFYESRARWCVVQSFQ